MNKTNNTNKNNKLNKLKNNTKLTNSAKSNESDSTTSDSAESDSPEEKFNCKYCNYHTSKPSDWLKHCKSQKHKRKGEEKTHKCPDCEYVCKTSWNMKLHITSQHSTKETRSDQKYYCADCDLVFFSDSYYQKHITGIKHKNFVNAILEQNKII